MPVLTAGNNPVDTTRVASMPVGAPRKSMDAIWRWGLSASVISYIDVVFSTASDAEPPTKRTMAGAHAITKPPMP